MKTATLLLTGLLLNAGPAAAQTPPPAPAPPACGASEHRQFDFWVGSWDVYPTGNDNQVARSLIERLYNGCAIRENWMPLKGGGGGSLNNYVVGQKGWRQTWLDSSGARVEFKGGWNGQAMVLTGLWADLNGPGQGALVRMTYTKDAQGWVRQFGEASQDGGKTWTASFDFTYKPASAAAAPAG